TSTTFTTDSSIGRRRSRPEASAITRTSFSPARTSSRTIPSQVPSGVSTRAPRRSAQRYAPAVARRDSPRATRRNRRRSDPAAAADDLPDVRFAHLKVELDEIAVELLGDDNRARILHELLRDVLEERAHA